MPEHRQHQHRHRQPRRHHQHHRHHACTRRCFCRRAASLALLALAAPLLAACKQKTGPEAIHYDRDACEMCNMIISDPRFATEIRDPDGRIHKFDDIGDAIHWMENQPWFKAGQQPKEFWVMNFRDGKTWLDARKAFYLPDQVSPMDYGFAAVPTREPGSVNFTEMRRRVIAKGIHARCTVPGRQS